MDENADRLEVEVELFSGESEVTLTIYTVDDSATGIIILVYTAYDLEWRLELHNGLF